MIQMLMSLIWMMESNEKIIIAIDKVQMKELVQPIIGMSNLGFGSKRLKIEL